jgi:ElaB/YqjD/DUF883 family membrane-anchored ribosome-binding protein
VDQSNRETNRRAERVIEHGRALREDARGLASELSAAAQEIKAKMDVSQSIQAHPFRAVLVAAGVGYVLGGGLFSPLTGTILRVGFRAMLVPMLKGQLENVVAGAVSQQA